MNSRGGRKPESIIQDAIIQYLRGREWVVKSTHGNAYQSGFPDLYAAHVRYGQRWIEVKKADKYQFTPAQLQFFPQLSSVGIGVWVLVAATADEYLKLWQPPNWHQYLPVNKVHSRTRPAPAPVSIATTTVVASLGSSNRVIRRLVKRSP